MTPATSDLHNVLKSRRLAWQKYLKVQGALESASFKLIHEAAAVDSNSATKRFDGRPAHKSIDDVIEG